MSTTSQEHLYEILMERVSTDRYPSHQLLDRLEESLWTSEQVTGYVNMLLEKIDESWYPSGQLLDRVQRMMSLAAVAAIRSSAPNDTPHNGASS